MPIYEYACESCEKIHEVFQKHGDGPLGSCPDCGGSVRKLISNSTFVLKGAGWYKTDYASPADKKKGLEGPSHGLESPSKGIENPSGPAENKPQKTEAKTETKTTDSSSN